MRSPCAPHKELYQNQNPLTEKWYNCKYDGEAMPLESKEGLDDFKKLCPSMYTNDQQPLCCNAEQLKILKNDLLTAQTLIGSCSSCYFNFRYLWCNYACHPNQSDFVIPRNVTELVHRNFTNIYESYKNNTIKKESESYDDYYDEDYEYDDDYEEKTSIKKKDTKDTKDKNITIESSNHNYQKITIQNDDILQATTKTDEDIAYTDEYDDNYDSNDKEKRIRKRRAAENLLGSPAQAVVYVDFFISRTFMNELVKSCQ